MPPSGRNVRGVLFADYVRMIRSRKDVDWSSRLPPEDMVYLKGTIDPDTWYPMAAYERLGNGILQEIANNELEAVRLWGRLSADVLLASNPALVAKGDVVETLMRFKVHRSTYFDFQALSIATLVDDHAHIVIAYQMGRMAEEAAAYQTLGFFARLVEAAGGIKVQSKFLERSWTGDARTLLEIRWSTFSL